MATIKIRDFAKEVNCTPQNIYKHLKTYAEELDGHTQQTKRGLVLDEFAQDFIRAAMYPKEISGDTELQNEIGKLRASLLEQAKKSMDLAAQLATVEGERDRALLEVDHYQKALTTSQEAEKEKDEQLQQAKELADKLREEADMRAQQAESEAEENAKLQAEIDKMKSAGLWERIKGWK